MKKTLLLLVLFFNFSAFGQQLLENYCGDTTFDLTTIIPLLNQNPSQVSSTFHLTQSDANSNSNAIVNATNYSANSLSQIIFARIKNLITNEVTINSFYIFINAAMPVELTFSLDFPTSTGMALPYSGQEPYTYEWSLNGVVLPNETANTINILNLPTGLLSVVVTDANGCSGYTSENIFTQQTIIANDDAGNTVNPITGGIAYTNVLLNDTLNGSPVLASEVIVSMVSTTNPGVILSGLDVIIAAGTPVGSYVLTYQICEIANPNNCDTAVVAFAIPNSFLNAEDDFFNVESTTNGNTIFPNILANDTLNGIPVLTSQVNVTFVSSSNNGITLSGTDVIVATGISSGLYSLTYQICEINNPNNCSTASVIIIVNGGVSNSGSINLINYTASPRPGFVYNNYILFTNSTTETISSGTITFTKDNLLSITAVSESNVVNTATGFTFSFTDLLPNEEIFITVSMQVPTIPTVNLGDLLVNKALISYFNGTETIENDSFLVQSIIGSYDPNDKTESHGGKILHSTFTANDYLTYTIRFENTGTAEAINVRVNDLLDAKLDETSIRMVRASHPYVLDRIGNDLNWNFDGINLPPSTPNDPITGHGYIVFQVKPKPGYVIGDIIPNSANIYFDFNPAIVTEPCLTEFVNTLSTNTFALNDLQLYPNPIKNIVSISNTSTIDTIAITSVLGQEILRKSVNDLQTEIDLSSLSNGIYFVKVSANDQEKTIKIVKE